MATKERLLVEIETLSEDEAAAVLEFLELRKDARNPAPWPPSFAAIGRSGHPDLGERSEEFLEAEFGST